MIRIIKVTDNNIIDDAVKLRLEMLREVNSLPDDHTFSDKFIEDTKKYILSGDQSSFTAYEDGTAIGCASICYYNVMPTYVHPSGKRAHIMNIYTKPDSRRQGLASTLIFMLIEEAKEKGVTEITLDAADNVRDLYYKTGFTRTDEGMVMDINKMLRQNIENAERTGCKPQVCGH